MANAKNKSKWFQWFMVFLLALVVAISLGLVIYYFVQNDETIRFKNNLLKANADEEIVVEIEHNNASKGTTIELYSYDESILDFIDEKSDKTHWVFKAFAGGETEVVLKTNSSNYKESPTQTCKISIGDGTQSNPYYVSNASDFTKINSRGVDKWYLQTQDIDLGAYDNWNSVGGANGFTGNYNGQGYTIFNLKSTNKPVNSSSNIEKDGLFTVVGKGGIVTNFTIKNASINSSANYVGAVAGFNCGTISKVSIISSTIKSTSTEAYVGAIAGTMRLFDGQSGNVRIEQVAIDENTSVIAETSSGKACVGGIIGAIQSGTIANSYSRAEIQTANVSEKYVGGLVGVMVSDTSTAASTAKKANIVNSYVVPHFVGTHQGAIVGKVLNSEISACRFDGVYYVSDSSDENAWTSGQGMNYSETTSGDAYTLVEKISTNLAKSQSTYTYITNDGNRTSWDFDKVWSISKDSNSGYPTLRMGDVVQDDIWDPNSAPEGEEIDTQAELQKIKNKTDGTYTLKKNAKIEIDMSTWETIANFNGTIEGNGARLALTGSTSKTLFGTFDANAKVKNLTIVGINIERVNGDYVGGLASVNNGTLDNIDVSGSIKSNKVGGVGGIVGLNTKLITNSDADSLTIVSATSSGSTTKVGGIAGENRGTISNCQSSATIKESSSNQGTIIAGGIAGHSTESAVIENAVAMANITLETNYDTVAGGIVGLNEDRATITKSKVFSGAIKAKMVGGIAGQNNGEDTNEFVSISRTQVESGVTLKGENAGGLVGNLVRGVVENCATYAKLSANTMAGFAVYVQGSTGSGGNGKYATIRTSFASVNFDTAVGKAYAETKSVIRGTNFAWYCMLHGESSSNPNSYKLAGYINDCVYNNASGGERCGHSEIPILWTGSDNKGYSESDCKKASTYEKFSTEIWNIEDGKLPTLKF